MVYAHSYWWIEKLSIVGSVLQYFLATEAQRFIHKMWGIITNTGVYQKVWKMFLPDGVKKAIAKWYVDV
jgi:hypothetical protein